MTGRWVLAGMALFAGWMSWFCLERNARFGAGILDLGLHDQMVWLASRGADPWLTTRGLSVLQDHFTPAAWLLAPLYFGAGSLLVLQAAATASGAWPVYRLSGRADLALLYLLHPVVQWQAAFDFHLTTLVTPLFLWALMFRSQERLGGYYACLALALTTGEAIGFTVVALAWVVRDWRTFWLGAGGLGVAGVTMHVALGGEPSQYLGLYGRWSWDPDMLVTVLVLLAPLAFLPLGCPARLVPALPALLGNALAWRPAQHDFTLHYEAAVVPFLFWAAAEALPRLRWRWPLAAAGVVGLALGPRSLPGAVGLEVTLPPEASVSAENVTGGWLSERPSLYLFPNPFQSAVWGNHPGALAEGATNHVMPLEPGALRRAARDASVQYVVFVTARPNGCPLPDEDREYYLQGLVGSGWYRVARSEPGVTILERR